MTAAAIVAAAALIFIELAFAAKAQLLLGDFRAFYCAGAAVLHGRDPYAAASLYACQQSAMPFGLYHASGGTVVPAPFPGYALWFFALFAALPYVAACVLWLAVLLSTTAASCVTLARLCGTGVAAAISILVVPLAVVVLPYGELTPVVLCALLYLAAALRSGRWNAAVVAAAFVALLPHVGVPALLGVFLFAPAMRWRIVALAAVLIVLDVAAGGVHTATAYFTSVLPAHTVSEIAGVTQYGLTWMLYAAGVADTLAVHAGEAWYLLMLVCGLSAAGLLVRRGGDAAYAALVPPAFAVLGGSFMHYTEIIVALGAAALLATRSMRSVRILSAGAVVLLAMPWLSLLGQPFLIVAFAVTSFAIALLLLMADTSAALRLALGAVVIAAVIVIAGGHFGPQLPHVNGAASLDSSLAQSSWAQFVGATRSSTGIVWWIAKAPTWLGLVLLLAAAMQQPEAAAAAS